MGQTGVRVTLQLRLYEVSWALDSRRVNITDKCQMLWVSTEPVRRSVIQSRLGRICLGWHIKVFPSESSWETELTTYSFLWLWRRKFGTECAGLSWPSHRGQDWLGWPQTSNIYQPFNWDNYKFWTIFNDFAPSRQYTRPFFVKSGAQNMKELEKLTKKNPNSVNRSTNIIPC